MDEPLSFSLCPILDALHLGKMLAGVFMSNDLCPDGIQPYVAVGMIEMPVRVDQVRDGIGAKIGKSSGDLRTRYTNTGIDKHFAVGAGQDGDVSAGALEYADVVSQLVRNDGRHGGAILDQADDAARLRKRLARRKPSPPTQQRQKRRRDNDRSCENCMACSLSWRG